jgi:hypothetical protein
LGVMSSQTDSGAPAEYPQAVATMAEMTIRAVFIILKNHIHIIREDLLRVRWVWVAPVA